MTTIIIDVSVANLSIRAAKPIQQNNPMPTSEADRVAWWNTVNPDRLNKREYGILKGKALKKAQKLVNSQGGIGVSGEVGSISINEKDFVPL